MDFVWALKKGIFMGRFWKKGHLYGWVLKRKKALVRAGFDKKGHLYGRVLKKKGTCMGRFWRRRKGTCMGGFWRRKKGTCMGGFWRKKALVWAGRWPSCGSAERQIEFVAPPDTSTAPLIATEVNKEVEKREKAIYLWPVSLDWHFFFLQKVA